MHTNGLRLRDIEKKAALFGVTLNQAIGARRSFLNKEFDYYMTCECDYLTWRVICLPSITDILKELSQLRKDLFYRSMPKSQDEITPEMIQDAKSSPVTAILDLANGKTRAFCHDDARPSLYVLKRINKAHCPVCDKKFDAIDILMQRDGLSFPDAVRKLCQG
jgi:hypothetical protein